MKKLSSPFYITTVISSQDLVNFQKIKQEFLKDKEIRRQRLGVSMIPMANDRGNMVAVPMPYLYVEYICTEEEYNAWKSRLTMY